MEVIYAAKLKINFYFRLKISNVINEPPPKKETKN